MCNRLDITAWCPALLVFLMGLFVCLPGFAQKNTGERLTCAPPPAGYTLDERPDITALNGEIWVDYNDSWWAYCEYKNAANRWIVAVVGWDEGQSRYKKSCNWRDYLPNGLLFGSNSKQANVIIRGTQDQAWMQQTARFLLDIVEPRAMPCEDAVIPANPVPDRPIFEAPGPNLQQGRDDEARADALWQECRYTEARTLYERAAAARSSDQLDQKIVWAELYTKPGFRFWIGDDDPLIRTEAQQEAFVNRVTDGLYRAIVERRPAVTVHLPPDLSALEQEWPWEGPYGLRQFMSLLWAAKAPQQHAAEGNAFAAYTGPYLDPTGRSLESRLRRRILASSGRLTPPQVAGLALDVTGGNYALAMLTTHNLLKNVTYVGRDKRDAFFKDGPARRTRYPERYDFEPEGALAARLVNLRPSSCYGPGHEDKMGPWYHMFIVLTFSSWTGSLSASGAVAVENGLRWCCGTMGFSPADPIKAAFDWAAVNASYAISRDMFTTWITELNADYFGFNAPPPGPDADPNVLLDAVSRNDPGAVEALLNRGYDPDTINPDGWSALQWAAELGVVEALQVLLRGGADINRANQWGMTALHYAAWRGHRGAVEALLAAGADPYVFTEEGWSPLLLAEEYGHAEIARLLRRAEGR